MSAASPIADLSYRGYDGPLDPPRMRWWVIARATMKMAIKKRAFWLWSVVGLWYYFIMMIVFYFVENIGGQQGKLQFFSRIVWKDQFVHGFSFGQMFLFVIALLVGAGSIANDNRANALLVYLSKPCRKFDYLFGKWVGIAALVSAVALAPMLLFYLYCMLSYRSYGFPGDGWIVLKIIPVALAAGAFHASLILGISSLFNQGRIAGATYAGLYFMTNFATVIMLIIREVSRHEGRGSARILNLLSYCSIDGILIGLSKIFIGTDGSPAFGAPVGRNQLPPAPPVAATIVLFVVLSALGVWVAWKRIRAVEVVS